MRKVLISLLLVGLCGLPAASWVSNPIETPMAGAANHPDSRNQGRPQAPSTGRDVPEMSSFDRMIPALMREYNIPGGAIGVVKDGRLIFARGYGWADREARQPVQPDSLFRIASLTKAFTATAILILVQDGRLKLDDRAFAILDNLKPARGANVDRRIYQITIRELLQHSGGWDRDKSFDPMFMSDQIAQAMGQPAPARPETIIRFMLGKPLQFNPGTRYAYSNFGYCILGRIIERVSGESYEQYVREHVLRPAGISSMKLGHTLLREQAPREVRYYGYPGMGRADSVFPGGGQVPWPYGGWYIEAMDSHGGWIASTMDLLRFLVALDEGRIIRKNLVSEMTARPAPPLWEGSDTWYGFGLQVRTAGNGFNWWHEGSLDGTSTLMVRAFNGLKWVALYNSRPQDSDKFGGEMDDIMWRAIGQVSRFPAGDQFVQFRVP
ncbi:MAG TPA: serine hydrolase domain-containing protein [Blastocatellia bacterium]|nr:serine hydrolase domain-containing protein [Blastocatellia bacterium]